MQMRDHDALPMRRPLFGGDLLAGADHNRLVFFNALTAAAGFMVRSTALPPPSAAMNAIPSRKPRLTHSQRRSA